MHLKAVLHGTFLFPKALAHFCLQTITAVTPQMIKSIYQQSELMYSV